MRALLDTHILLWASATPDRLPEALRAELDDPSHDIVFSAISIWEVAIKAGLGRADFTVDAHRLAQGLRRHGYRELPFSAAHASAINDLPAHHADPFDRALIAQGLVERIELITADHSVARYGGLIRLVSR